MKRLLKVVIGMSVVTFVSSSLIGAHNVSAEKNTPNDLSVKIIEWQEQGIDPNHSEVIENIKGYIDQNIPEAYASMHIDRDERELGILIFSFTEPVSEQHKQAMREFVTEHSKVQFRQVEYTDKELMEKQKKIRLNDLESEGISIHHTSLDTINNKVEIGISPYNDETIETALEYYGEAMISVIEGQPLNVMQDDDAVDTGKDSKINNHIEDSAVEPTKSGEAEQTTALGKDTDTVIKTTEVASDETKDEPEPNIFQKFFSTVKEWFTNLF